MTRHPWSINLCFVSTVTANVHFDLFYSLSFFNLYVFVWRQNNTKCFKTVSVVEIENIFDLIRLISFLNTPTCHVSSRAFIVFLSLYLNLPFFLSICMVVSVLWFLRLCLIHSVDLTCVMLQLGRREIFWPSK